MKKRNPLETLPCVAKATRFWWSWHVLAGHDTFTYTTNSTTTTSQTTNLVCLCNFYAASRTQGLLDVAVDGKLTSGKSSYHEETGADARV
jgi:hypothetical protein